MMEYKICSGYYDVHIKLYDTNPTPSTSIADGRMGKVQV